MVFYQFSTVMLYAYAFDVLAWGVRILDCWKKKVENHAKIATIVVSFSAG